MKRFLTFAMFVVACCLSSVHFCITMEAVHDKIKELGKYESANEELLAKLEEVGNYIALMKEQVKFILTEEKKKCAQNNDSKTTQLQIINPSQELSQKTVECLKPETIDKKDLQKQTIKKTNLTKKSNNDRFFKNNFGIYIFATGFVAFTVGVVAAPAIKQFAYSYLFDRWHNLLDEFI